MLIKIHSGYRNTVAVCDSELIGQIFEEGNRQIELKPHFFQGEEKDKNETVKILKDLQKEDATFNIVGKKSVQAALEAGIVKKEGIITIDGVPVALVLL